jgi:hypothetical protein
MKPFITYISLLLLSSGLIFSSYWSSNSKATPIIKQAEAKHSFSKEASHPQYFSLQQIIEFAIPALKK